MSQMSDYVYDPTRRFYRVYDNFIGLPIMIMSYVGSFFVVIAALGITFGDHNYTVGAILFGIFAFLLFMALPSIHCNSKKINEKRTVYVQYRSMNKLDRKRYVSTIRAIHKDGYGEESINYSDLEKLFRMKSLKNSKSIGYERARIKQDIADMNAQKRLDLSSQAEVDKINSVFDL